eukprot:gene31273-37793_t
MFVRRLYLPTLAACALAARSASRYVAQCDGTPAGSFDTKGLPTRFEVDLSQAKQKTTLHLAGAGMRRKNFYVVAVDVYKVGLGLSSDTISRAIEWAKVDGQKGSLSPYILKANTTKAVRAAVILKFVRSVTNAQFIEAFRDSFSDCNPASFQAFETFMKAAFGNSGLNVDDEVGFYWLADGQLVITMNGKNFGAIAIAEVSERLLDVYVDPKRAVSPELLQSVEKNVALVSSNITA